MKVLVTGGGGFIGSNIVEELLRQGFEVNVIDNFSTGKRENLSPFEKDINLIEGDIRSYHIVQEAVNGVDVILHQAALPSVPRSIKDPITTNEVNISGTLNLLESAVKANVKRFVYASSSSVYGDSPQLPKKETMEPNPLSPYAVSKLAGEKYCQVFNRIYGIETICLRYFNVFGLRQDPTSQYSAVIPKFITLMMNDKQPVIYGDGKQSRDFTYVANVVKANLLAATKEIDGSYTLNCACHDRIDLIELVKKINAQLGKDIEPVFADARKGDVKHSFADIDLAKEKLDYEVVVNFDEGLSLTIENLEGIRNLTI
ncbi:MAG: SDR family oxidoreductase [Ignavibacteriae bacterium]|nr:SDR family oxidoreductase [Ignavibacteriota bacterium]MCB9244024.1 SDR family oxidoreductase [Ignavibacteriales bacterium]